LLAVPSPTAPTRQRRQTVSQEDRERIIAKSLEGHSVSSIASMYDVKYQTISSIIRKYLQTGLVIPEKRRGDRRTKLSLHVKNALLIYIDAECTKTLKELAE
ncbi:hypothetical protein CDIK_3817, partial [Cucumispora dikerogammari]